MATVEDISKMFKNYVASNLKKDAEVIYNLVNEYSGQYTEAHVFLGVPDERIQKSAGAYIKDIKVIIDELDSAINHPKN